MMKQDAREEQAIKESKTSKNTTQSNLKRIENETPAFGKRLGFVKLSSARNPAKDMKYVLIGAFFYTYSMTSMTNSNFSTQLCSIR